MAGSATLRPNAPDVVEPEAAPVLSGRDLVANERRLIRRVKWTGIVPKSAPTLARFEATSAVVDRAEKYSQDEHYEHERCLASIYRE